MRPWTAIAERQASPRQVAGEEGATHEMMNLTVSSSRGMMMCSIELTRRFVARMTSSRTVKAV